MGLARALVDRCRRLYVAEDPTLPWVDGSPPGELRYGPWIPCRIQVRQPRERSGSGRYRYLEGDAELMLGTDDENGELLFDDVEGSDTQGQFQAFDADDLLEVSSAELGTAIWRVNTGAEALRRRASVAGYLVGLVRAREPTVAEETLEDGGQTGPGVDSGGDTSLILGASDLAASEAGLRAAQAGEFG